MHLAPAFGWGFLRSNNFTQPATMNTEQLSFILSNMLGQDVQFTELSPDEHGGEGPCFRAMWTDNGRTNSITSFSSDKDAAYSKEWASYMPYDVQFIGNIRFSSTLD